MRMMTLNELIDWVWEAISFRGAIKKSLLEAILGLDQRLDVLTLLT